MSTAASTIDLRDLAPTDIDAMADLERACYAIPWSRGMLADELAREHGAALGLWDDGALVAMLLAARLADAWHVLNVAVLPDRRRTGVATRLLSELFGRTGSDGFGFTLEVRPSNPGAQLLYERHGFVAVGTRPRYYADGEDAVVMWRPPQDVVAQRERGTWVDWEPPT